MVRTATASADKPKLEATGLNVEVMQVLPLTCDGVVQHSPPVLGML